MRGTVPDFSPGARTISNFVTKPELSRRRQQARGPRMHGQSYTNQSVAPSTELSMPNRNGALEDAEALSPESLVLFSEQPQIAVA